MQRKSITAALITGLAAVVLSLASPASAGDGGETAYATFAGGCFWCMEADFEKLDGVLSVTSGYTGGTAVNPTYTQVSAGGTGHAEAVRVVYDPKAVSYDELLTYFWRHIDPTVKDRQFCDVGHQYRSAVFFHDKAQREAAERSRAELERTKPFPQPVVTEITAESAFYPAEAYHQDYAEKNPIRYAYYRRGCGRDQRLRELWGDEK